jgi:signal transduction histidine kinase
VLRWAADQDWGARIPVTIEMLMAIVFAAVQWRKTRGQPLERAALRWFTLSTLVGSGLFIFITFGSQVLGLFVMPQQGYAFGYFLIIYIGIALGLRHYQLFDMDEWAYRGFMWVVGAISVIALDALLLYFGLTEATSLGFSLLIAGWLYFPLRQWMWQRIVKRNFPKFEHLLPELSAIAFTASYGEQKIRWESFLMRVFDPLELKQGEADIKESRVCEDGLALQISASSTLPSYTLRYAAGGTRLFSTRDADFALALSQLLQQVMGGRSSYEQGVTEERLRISRDLHDNIGARLLKLIHHLRGSPDAEIARDAMKDLRTAIAAMDTHPVPISNALADWRAEANSRCEAAGCNLHWLQPEILPEVELLPRTKAMLESVMRELVTNALKHASPDNIKIKVDADAAQLQVSVSNDGNIAETSTWKDGYGLRNIRGRLDELGGSLNISAIPGEVLLSIKASLI